MNLDPITGTHDATTARRGRTTPRAPAPEPESAPRDSRSRPIGHLNSVRRWTLAIADSAAVVLGAALAFAAGKLTSATFAWDLLLIPTWILVAKIHNLYDNDHRRIRHSTFDEIPALLATSAFTVGIIKGITELLAAPKIPSSALIIIGGSAFVLSLILRGLVRLAFSRLSRGEVTAVVGSSPKAEMVARRLAIHPEAGIELAGFVAESPEFPHGPETPDLEYFGTSEEIDRIAAENGIERVVIADDAIDSRALGRIINTCRQAGIAVTVVPAQMEILGPDTELNRIAEVPMLDFHFSDPPRSTMTIKRLFDIGVSGALLVLLSPLLLICAIVTKLDSRGPVMFSQKRVGQDGKVFTMYKLRTMVDNAESRLDDLIDLEAMTEPAFKIENDPRVTRFGKIMRRTSMDEVPQFFNVLKGDMSLVGPRPEEEAVVSLYDERQRQRLAVKPGLTGPMQVYGRGSLAFEERLALERDYLDNISISGDIAILLRTPRAVVRGEGSL